MNTKAVLFFIGIMLGIALTFFASGLYFGTTYFLWNEQRQGNEIHITGQDYCCLPCNQTTGFEANLSDQANPRVMPRR